MEQLQQLIKNQKGQLLVEILLAIALTAIMLPALLTGLFSSRQGKSQEKQRVQAVALIKEAEEVVKNIREQGWSNISTNGTFHPQISGNNWILAPGSEIINNLTRTITISDVQRDSSGTIVLSGGTIDQSTKRVFIQVVWGLPYTSSVNSTLYMTRFKGNAAQPQTTVTDFNSGTNNSTTVVDSSGGEVTLGAGGGGGDWCDPSFSVTTVNLSRQGVPTAISAYEGSIVTGTGGNASGPTFVKTSVDDNSPPNTTFVGEYNNSKANNVFTADNYGYIATTNNSEEVQILNLQQYSNPPTNTNFVKSGYFNAPGNSQGNSVFTVGNFGYMAAGNKFYIFDLSSKSGSRPQLNSSVPTLAGNGVKIVVNGNYAYVAVDSITTQFQIINVSDPANPTIVASKNVNNQPGVDLAVNSTGTRVYLITNYLNSTQPNLYILNTSSKTDPIPSVGTGYNTNAMQPKGISVATGNKIVVVGTGGSRQYQVVNISNEASPTICGSIAIPGGVYAVNSVLQSNGYAYSYIATGDSNAELKIILGGAGGQFSFNGEFISSAINPGSTVNYNYFTPIFNQPNQTQIRFQVAVSNAINGSCTSANYTFVGPDGTVNTYYYAPGAIPITSILNYNNPGQCMKYKAYFSTNDTSSSPTLEEVYVNYSP